MIESQELAFKFFDVGAILQAQDNDVTHIRWQNHFFYPQELR